ncbi:histidine phosphatase family protein [Longivirga aurantiaca]|uniref:Histidine phosphatase family protein n=1 Tax=Longivirga aurantiaca TaxID=1837743 RepID=A0ABW1T1A0_9ACTN
MTAIRGRIVVLRHAETSWSRDGRHTGRTDVPLTPEGEEAARAAAARIAAFAPGLVLTSPLLRARRTAELAGLSAEVEPDLLEWDYGVYEGRTTQGIKDDLGDPAWSVWTTLDGLGEPVDDVGARAARVLTRCQPVVESGEDVVLVAHAHLLRILTAVHLGLPAIDGRSFVLPPAGIGVLGWERSTRALLGWGL